jgi:hypothetical protein
MPELYMTITIRAESEMYLEKVGVRRVMLAGINPVGHLQYVRNVQVQSSFHENLEICFRSSLPTTLRSAARIVASFSWK